MPVNAEGRCLTTEKDETKTDFFSDRFQLRWYRDDSPSSKLDFGLLEGFFL